MAQDLVPPSTDNAAAIAELAARVPTIGTRRMRVEPLYDRILVEVIKEGTVSRGGIVVPDIAQGKRPYCYGEVVAIGPGLYHEGKLQPLIVKVGDVVVYPRRSGMIIPIPGDEDKEEAEVTLLHEREVLGIVHDMPRKTSIVGVDGRLLAMQPKSHAPIGIETWEESKEIDAKLREEGWSEGLDDPNLDAERPQAGEH